MAQVVNGQLLPDIAGSFNAGFDRSQQNRFNMLAGQGLAGNQDALNQAAQINPIAATQLQGMATTNAANQYGLQQQQQVDNRTKLGGAARYMIQAIQSKNPAQIEGAYQNVRPLLDDVARQHNMPPPPPNFTQDQLPGIYQLAAQDPQEVNGQSADFKDFQALTAAAGLQPGTNDYQKAAAVKLRLSSPAATGGFSFSKFTDSSGRERLVRQDPTTGNIDVMDESGSWAPIGGSGQRGQPRSNAATQPTPEQLMAQATQMANQGGPSANADAAQQWLVQQLASQGRQPQLPNGQAAIPQAANGPQVVQNALVGPTAGDLSYAKEAGQQRATTEALPTQEAIKTNAAIAKSQGEGQAKAMIENSQKAAQSQQDAQKTLALLDTAEPLLGQAAGGTIAHLGNELAGAAGYSTPSAQAQAKLKVIAGQLTSSVPRMQGPQSDKDVQLYREMAGDLANESLPVQTRLAALNGIRGLQQKYIANPIGMGIARPNQSSSSIPAAAIQLLRSNPQLKAQFDAKYGPGSSDQVLGGGNGR